MDFSAVFADHYSDIYRFTYRILGTPEDASDATQETFTKLLAFLNTGGKVLSPRPWLYQVAANRCNSVLRRMAVHRRALSAVAPREEPQHPGAESELIAEQERARLRAALQQLAARDRLLLLLYQDDMSYAEMAAVINVRKTSVGALLSRAMARLERAMDQGGAR
jgi:RNA polymerase sigma factor (sigma-70 family)